jgi:hypothetical protein
MKHNAHGFFALPPVRMPGFGRNSLVNVQENFGKGYELSNRYLG